MTSFIHSALWRLAIKTSNQPKNNKRIKKIFEKERKLGDQFPSAES